MPPIEYTTRVCSPKHDTMRQGAPSTGHGARGHCRRRDVRGEAVLSVSPFSHGRYYFLQPRAVVPHPLGCRHASSQEDPPHFLRRWPDREANRAGTDRRGAVPLAPHYTGTTKRPYLAGPWTSVRYGRGQCRRDFCGCRSTQLMDRDNCTALARTAQVFCSSVVFSDEPHAPECHPTVRDRCPDSDLGHPFLPHFVGGVRNERCSRRNPCNS